MSQKPPLFVKAVPGLENSLFLELQHLFSHPWLPRTSEKPQCEIRAGGVFVQGLTRTESLELLFRLRSAEDVFQVLFRGKVAHWNELEVALDSCFSQKDALGLHTFRIRVQSKSSLLFHEGAVRQRAEERLKKWGWQVEAAAEDGKNSPAHTLVQLFFEQNKLEIRLSFTNQSLGKRAYKAPLPAPAPLREEQAAALIEHVRAEWQARPGPWHIWVPFAGSGTFGFESLLALRGVSLMTHPKCWPVCQTSAWSEKTWSSFLKKQQKICQASFSELRLEFLERQSQAFANLKEHLIVFQERLRSCCAGEEVHLEEGVFSAWEGDFFERGPTWTSAEKGLPLRHLWIPLNPPFGRRLGSKPFSYGKLAHRLLQIQASSKGHVASVQGVLLCPSENTWQEAFQVLKKEYQLQTLHFMQGGQDMRALYFSSSEGKSKA
jgi:23S rRNA G2445 N2-methylase RlmL